MNVFLDTEFSDLLAPKLISIGMVADSGEEFYAELPFNRDECSPFVKDIVLPLLGREPFAACEALELRGKILSWLQIVRRKGENLLILSDSAIDLKLIHGVLGQSLPSWVGTSVAEYEIGELLVEDFFKREGLPRHHALYDARANRYAYRPRQARMS